MLLSLGHFREAVQELTLAVDLDPKDARTRVFLGMAHERLSEGGKARSLFAEALRLDPGNQDAIRGVERVGQEKPGKVVGKVLGSIRESRE